MFSIRNVLHITASVVSEGAIELADVKHERKMEHP